MASPLHQSSPLSLSVALKKNSTAIWICISLVQANAHGLVKAGGSASRFLRLADQHAPLHPRRSPPHHQGGATEQEKRVEGGPLPWRRKIEKDRLLPGVADIVGEKGARHPAVVAPKREQIGACQAIVQQQRRADADAGNFQRRRRLVLEPEARPVLEPEARPGLAQRGERGPARGRRGCLHGRQRHWAGHRMASRVRSSTNSGSSGCFPLNRSAGEKSFCSSSTNVIATGCSAACSRQNAAAAAWPWVSMASTMSLYRSLNQIEVGRNLLNLSAGTNV